MNKNNNRVKDAIESTLSNLSKIIDVNTVFGKPIESSNGFAVPVTKITLGIALGGGEYGKVNIFNKSNDLPFTAGNCAVVSIKPCGFLTCVNNEFKMISTSTNVEEKTIEKIFDYISNLQ